MFYIIFILETVLVSCVQHHFTASFCIHLYLLWYILQSMCSPYSWTICELLCKVGIIDIGMFWRYLTRGLIWHLSQSSKGPQFILVRLWHHARIRSWNQPVLLAIRVKFLAKGNNGGLWWGSNPRPPHYESDVLVDFSPSVLNYKYSYCHTHCIIIIVMDHLNVLIYYKIDAIVLQTIWTDTREFITRTVDQTLVNSLHWTVELWNRWIRLLCYYMCPLYTHVTPIL